MSALAFDDLVEPSTSSGALTFDDLADNKPAHAPSTQPITASSALPVLPAPVMSPEEKEFLSSPSPALTSREDIARKNDLKKFIADLSGNAEIDRPDFSRQQAGVRAVQSFIESPLVNIPPKAADLLLQSTFPPFLAVKKLAPKRAEDIATGVAETASGFTSPENLGLLAAMGGAPAAVEKTAALGFGALAGLGAIEQGKEFWNETDPSRRTVLATEMLLNAGVGGLALKSGLSPVEKLALADTQARKLESTNLPATANVIRKTAVEGVKTPVEASASISAPLEQPAPEAQPEAAKPAEAPVIPAVPQTSAPKTAIIATGTPHGARAHVQYDVMEANDLKPLIVADVNEAQTRQRAGNKASDEQIAKIATTPDTLLLGESPTSMHGAPVVDDKVLAGNGRASGIVAGYEGDTLGSQQYRQWANEQAANLGLGDISGMKQPVIVRRVKNFPQGDRRSFVTESNPKYGALQETLTEGALLDADAIGDLSALQFNEDGNLSADSLQGVATKLSGANRGLQRTTGGRPDILEATKRVQMASLAKMARDANVEIGDLSALVETDAGKRVMSEVTKAAPKLAALDPDLSMGSQLLSAMQHFHQGVRAVAQGTYKSLAQWDERRGSELFHDSVLSPGASRILDVLVAAQKKPTQLREFLSDYLENATREQNERTKASEGDDLLGEVRAKVSAETLLADSNARANDAPTTVNRAVSAKGAGKPVEQTPQLSLEPEPNTPKGETNAQSVSENEKSDAENLREEARNEDSRKDVEQKPQGRQDRGAGTPLKENDTAFYNNQEYTIDSVESIKQPDGTTKEYLTGKSGEKKLTLPREEWEKRRPATNENINAGEQSPSAAKVQKEEAAQAPTQAEAPLKKASKNKTAAWRDVTTGEIFDSGVRSTHAFAEGEALNDWTRAREHVDRGFLNHDTGKYERTGDYKTPKTEAEAAAESQRYADILKKIQAGEPVSEADAAVVHVPTGMTDAGYTLKNGVWTKTPVTSTDALNGIQPAEKVVSESINPKEAAEVTPQALGIRVPLPGFLQDIVNYFVNNTPSQIWNSVRGSIDATLGKTFAKTTIADREAGELGARWISSRIAAPHLARTFVANVLENTSVDPVKLGAALTEDNLRSVRKGFLDAGDITSANNVVSVVGSKGSPFRTETEYQAFLADKDAQTAIQRHQSLWESVIDPMFRKAQLLDPAEPLSTRGEQTQARINLYNDVEAKGKNIVSGTGTGNLTATTRKKSPFAIQAKGSGQSYNVNYDDMMANTFARQLEIANKNAFEKQLADSGNAIIGKPARDVKLPDGEETIAFPLKRTVLIDTADGGKIPVNQNIFVRKSLAGEYRRGADVDLIKVPALLRGFNNTVNKTALAGLTDASVHVLNLGTALLTRPAVAGGVLRDSMLSAFGRLDVPVVLIKSLTKAFQDNQAQLAELSEIGALRADYPASNPLSNVITWADKTTRLVMDDAFKKMARSGLVKNTETNRREFVNQIGQYNKRAQGDLRRLARDSGFGPFATAGTTFNTLGLRTITLSPGAEATGAMAAASLRANVLAKWVGAIAVVGTANYLLTGNVGGRPGVPFGKIDTGLNDENKHPLSIPVFDILGLGRALRVTGARGLIEGKRKGLSTQNALDAAATDIWNTNISPFTGPAIRFAGVASSGKQIPSVNVPRTSRVVPPGESQFKENLKQAIIDANPIIKSAALAREPGQGVRSAIRQQVPRLSLQPSQSAEFMAKYPQIVRKAQSREYINDVIGRARKMAPVEQRAFVDDAVSNLNPEDRAQAIRTLKYSHILVSESASSNRTRRIGR